MPDPILPGMPQPLQQVPLPDLSGTPKQVAWALDIRARLYPAALKAQDQRMRLLEVWTERGDVRPEKIADLRAQLAAGVDSLARLEKETSAHAWIANRDLEPLELLAGKWRED